MPVGLKDVNTFIGVKLTTAIIMTFLPLIRLYVLRNAIRTPLRVASEVFFGFAWIVGSAVHWYDSKTAFDEKNIRLRSQSELQVEIQIVTVTFSKVFSLTTLSRPI